MSTKLIVCSILLLTACATPKKYTQPELGLTLPHAWQNNQQLETPPSTSNAWWQLLNEPELNHLISKALNQNPSIKETSARLRQARANHAALVAGQQIRIGLNTGVSHNFDAAAKSANHYQVGFDASWEADLFDAKKYQQDASQAEVDISQAEVTQAQTSLIAEVTRNYIEWRAAQIQQQLAQQQLKQLQELQHLSQIAITAGLKSEDNFTQATLNLQTQQTKLTAIELDIQSAQYRLLVLTGKTPQSHFELGQNAQPFQALPQNLAAAIPAHVLLQRPDLIIAERQLAAASAKLNQAEANRWPGLKLDASFGWQAYQLSELFSPAGLVRSVSGLLASSLFDSGRLKQLVEVQNTAQEQALFAYQNSVLVALEEIENALARHASLLKQRDETAQALQSTQQHKELTQKQYQTGLVDFQQVLNAQQQQNQQQNNLNQIETNLRLNLVSLYKALGTKNI